MTQFDKPEATSHPRLSRNEEVYQIESSKYFRTQVLRSLPKLRRLIIYHDSANSPTKSAISRKQPKNAFY